MLSVRLLCSFSLGGLLMTHWREVILANWPLRSDLALKWIFFVLCLFLWTIHRLEEDHRCQLGDLFHDLDSIQEEAKFWEVVFLGSNCELWVVFLLFSDLSSIQNRCWWYFHICILDYRVNTEECGRRQ